jgi:hypothetical protein
VHPAREQIPSLFATELVGAFTDVLEVTTLDKLAEGRERESERKRVGERANAR